MKDVKDYLHLYLGCRVFVFPAETLVDGWYEKQRNESHFNEWWGTYILTPENIRQTVKDGYFPILRPLDSMTEEEAIYLAKLSEWEPHFRDVKTYRNQFNDIIVNWDGMCETREEFNATGELFYCSEQFQWLLKKGFDLFELIRDGIAIDKTKLPC